MRKRPEDGSKPDTEQERRGKSGYETRGRDCTPHKGTEAHRVGGVDGGQTPEAHAVEGIGAFEGGLSQGPREFSLHEKSKIRSRGNTSTPGIDEVRRRADGGNQSTPGKRDLHDTDRYTEERSENTNQPGDQSSGGIFTPRVYPMLQLFKPDARLPGAVQMHSRI